MPCHAARFTSHQAMTAKKNGEKQFYLVRPTQVSMVDGGDALLLHLGEHPFTTSLQVVLKF